MIKKVNLNFVALGLLVIAFSGSAIRYALVSATMQSSEDLEAGGKKIIRFSHWQLEPGYRDGLQWAIDEYNNLPHVKEADVEVMQIPLSDKIYKQFLTVHLISGTAPDLITGSSQISSGTNVARFYTPLSSIVTLPNPYNAAPYLPENADSELADYLATAPWAETFFNGMRSGFVDQLSDYYSAPISTAGGGRLFYNGNILRKVKSWLAEVYRKADQPTWLTQCWLRVKNGKEKGFLKPDEKFEAWLRSPEPPRSLGELLVYANAIKAFAEVRNIDTLIPFSASSYGPHDIILTIGRTFFFMDAQKLASSPDRLMEWSGLLEMEKGNFGWDSLQFQEFFEFGSIVSEFYPSGYQGLDREQSQRRFVLGRAAMITAAGWDAPGILYGAANRDTEDDQFEVVITPIPYPADGERWDEELPYQVSEAALGGAVSVNVNDSSPHKEAAMDFLKFITSFRVNTEMNRRTGWLPVIVGAHPREELEVFMPITEGIPETLTFWLDSNNVKVGLRNQWKINSRLVISGEITFEEYVNRMEAFLENPSVGLEKYIRLTWESSDDQTLNYEQSLAIERVRDLLSESHHIKREASVYYRLITEGEGVSVRREWNDVYPGRPIPEF